MNAQMKTDEDFIELSSLMKSAKRWILWKREKQFDKDGVQKKDKKIPYYANGQRRNGALDTQQDIDNFSIYENAINALNNGDYSGLGFALGPDGTGNYWQGVDFDKLSEHVSLGYMSEDLPGYVEHSPSGDGVHAIGYGRAFNALGSNETGIEAYSSGRYFTVTGECAGLGEPVCLADYVEKVLRPLHSSGQQNKEQEKCITEEVSPETINALRLALFYMSSDDRELWIRMGMALKTIGDNGRALWLAWSATSATFDPLNDTKTWDSFKPERANYKVVFSEAQKRGWVNPAKKIDKIEEVKESIDFELLQIKELIKNPINISWMIKGVLESGGVSLISGAYGSGKSFVAFDMAFCIASGMEWHGFKTKQAPVVVLAGEGHSGISDRFAALTIHYGMDCPDDLYLSKAPARLTDRINAAWVKKSVDTICPDAGIVIIDTLNRNFGEGDENSSRDMSAFINSVDDHFRESGKTVLIVHHTGHAEGNRARGSSVLPASCEGEFIISKKDNGLELECKKQKNGKKPENMIFNFVSIDLDRLDDDGDMITSLVLELSGEISGKSKHKRLGKNDKLALDCLKEALSQYGDEPFEHMKNIDKNIKTPLQIVHLEHWRNIFYKKLNANENTNRGTFFRCRNNLKTLGISIEYDDFCWIVSN